MGLIFVFLVFAFSFVFDIFKVIIIIFEWTIGRSRVNDESINK
jgi:hypothetical protein